MVIHYLVLFKKLKFYTVEFCNFYYIIIFTFVSGANSKKYRAKFTTMEPEYGANCVIFEPGNEN